MLVVSSPCALSATEVLLRSGSSIAAALDFFSNSNKYMLKNAY